MSEIYLSEKDGIPIAYVPKNKKIIYINDSSKDEEIEKCCKKCSKKCEKNVDKICCDYCCFYPCSEDDEINEEDFDLINSIMNNTPLTKKEYRDLEKLKYQIKVNRNKVKTNPKYNSLKKCLNKNKPKEILLTGNECINVIPNIDTREVCYVAGASGSGKSTWISNYAKEYIKLFPDNKIFLFSRVDDDKCLDELNPNRILMDESLIKDPIHPSELSNSLVVFDDTDTIPDKKLKDALNNLKRDVLEIGRHENIYVCITSHMIANYKETRTVLNEAHLIVFFPSSGSTYQITYMLKQYFGLNKNQIDKILHLPSRWVCAKRTFPQCVLYEKGVYLLS